MANLLTAADILLRVGVDATGVETELASKLTRSERVAVASGDRISASVAQNASKVQAAQLRVVAAQERYTRVLKTEGATQGQVASSQASLITARASLARETDRATASTKRLDRQTGSLAGTAKSFVAGFAGFAAFSFLRGGLAEVKDFQAGIAQTEAGIRSTGGAAHVTAGDVQDLAGQIQAYSGFTDDSVVSAQNLLLTFTKVRNEVGRGNDVFDRATRASADLQARGFSDLEGSAKQLGKALNDPIKGTTALSRAGVQFTAQQKATIESLVNTGDVLSAQKIILREVETQVGGSARAYGETLPGGLERSRRALEDFEQGTLQTIAPALEALAAVPRFFAEHSTARDAALFAGGTVAALAVLNKGVKLYGEVSANVFRRVPVQIAANTAEARSYDRVAGAANRAAVAKSRASGVGPPGAGALAGFGLPAFVVAAASFGVHELQSSQARERDSRRSSLAETLADPAKFAQAQARLATLERLNLQPTRGGGLQAEAADLRAAIEKAAPAARAAAKTAGAQVAQKFAEGVKENRAAIRDVAASFAIDPLEGPAGSKGGLGPDEVLERLKGTVARQTDLRGDIATLAGRGASQETLAVLRDLEKEAPGTIDRIAASSGKRYQQVFSRELDKLNRQTNAIAALYLGSENRADRNGRRDARAYARAFRDSLAEEDIILDFKQSGGFRPSGGGGRAGVSALSSKVLSGGFPSP